MSAPMNTFLTALETAIDTATTADVRVRRLIGVGAKVANVRDYITVTPGKDIPTRAESPTSYIVEVSAIVRVNVTRTTDSAAITALAELWQTVRKAIYGQAWGGRRYVEPSFSEEYEADPEQSNLYYYEVEVMAEFQESTT